MSHGSQERHPPGPMKFRRLLLGFRQSDIAIAAQVDLAIVSRAERGVRVSRAAKEKIAEALNSTPGELFPND